MSLSATVRIDGRDVGRVTDVQITTDDMSFRLGDRARLMLPSGPRELVVAGTLSGGVYTALGGAGNRAARRKARAEWRKAERNKR